MSQVKSGFSHKGQVDDGQSTVSQEQVTQETQYSSSYAQGDNKSQQIPTSEAQKFAFWRTSKNGDASMNSLQQSNKIDRFSSISSAANPLGIMLSNISAPAKKVLNSMNDILKEQESIGMVKTQLVCIDNQDHKGLYVSSIAVVTRYDHETFGSIPSLNNILAYHLILLESTVEVRHPIQCTAYEDGREVSYNIKHAPSDALNADYLAKVSEELNKKFPGYEKVYAESQVIASGERFNNDINYSNVLFKAITANGKILNDYNPNKGYLNLSGLSQDGQLSISVQRYNSDSNMVIGYDGLPVRSDYQILISQTPSRQRQDSQSLNSPQQVTIGSVQAHSDIRFVAPAIDNSDPNRIPIFEPEVIITNIHGKESESLDFTLFQIASCITLLNNETSMLNFRPMKSENKGISKLHDINGAVLLSDIFLANYNPPLMKKEDIGTGVITDLRDYVNFFNKFFSKTIMLSIDVPDSGSFASVVADFAEVSSPFKGADRVGSYNRIYQAAMNLTDGRFANYFEKDLNANPIVVRNHHRIPLGFYVLDQKNVNDNDLRDIREIDLLAITNSYRNSGDYNKILDYLSLINSTSQSDDYVNARLYDEYLANFGAHITSYATRCTLTPNFLLALHHAIRDTNIVMNVNRPVGINTGNDMAYAQGSSTLSYDQISPLGNAGFSGSSAFSGSINSLHGR